MKPAPQPSKPVRLPLTAVGAAEPFPVVLVESQGALGALFAQRRCPDERFEDVLYFRVLMDEPYAIFMPAVDLLTMDGYFVAQEAKDKGLIYEPSLIPYQMKNISSDRYGQFVDHIVKYHVKWVEKELVRLFSDCPGFSVDSEGKLLSPEDYASGFEHFMGSHPFVAPKEPSKRKN